MIRDLRMAGIIMAFAAMAVVGCTKLDKKTPKPVETVTFVDLNRYVGVW